jgi:hypothetical protein
VIYRLGTKTLREPPVLTAEHPHYTFLMDLQKCVPQEKSYLTGLLLRDLKNILYAWDEIYIKRRTSKKLGLKPYSAFLHDYQTWRQHGGHLPKDELDRTIQVLNMKRAWV